MRGDSERKSDGFKVPVETEAERSGTLKNFPRGVWERSERDRPPLKKCR